MAPDRTHLAPRDALIISRSEMSTLRDDGGKSPLRRALQINLRIAQISGRLLRRHGVDVEAGAPLEAGHARQTGNDLDVPVVMRQRLRVERRGVDDVVVRRLVEGRFQLRAGSS